MLVSQKCVFFFEAFSPSRGVLRQEAIATSAVASTGAGRTQGPFEKRGRGESHPVPLVKLEVL